MQEDKIMEDDGPWYLSARFWTITLTINAIVGLIIFEITWASTKRYRNPIKELDERFPMYRRIDAANWNKLRL